MAALGLSKSNRFKHSYGVAAVSRCLPMKPMSKFPNDSRISDRDVSRNRNRTTLYGRVGTDELGRKVQLFEIDTS